MAEKEDKFEIPTPPKLEENPIGKETSGQKTAASFSNPSAEPSASSVGATEPINAEIPVPEAVLGENFNYEDGRFARFKAWLSDFFSDRRKVVVAALVLFLAIGGFVAFLALRGDGGSQTGAQTERGVLPIADPNKGSDFVARIYQPALGTAVVRWRTKVPTDGRVSYGTDKNLGFYEDDQSTLHPSDYKNSHQVVLTGLEKGFTYYILASSIDKDKNSYFSQVIEVKVELDTEAPQVSFLNPPNGASLRGLACAELKASDNKGVQSITLLLDGKIIAEKKSNFNACIPISTGNYPNGNHTLTAIVSDGVNTNEASVNVSIDNNDPSGLSRNINVDITRPQEGEVVSGNVSVQATASDSTGQTVTDLKLYLDGAYQSTISGSSGNFQLDSTKYNEGYHRICVYATNSSNQYNSDCVVIYINNDSDDDNDGIPDWEDGDDDNDGIPDRDDPYGPYDPPPYNPPSGGEQDNDPDGDGNPSPTDPDDDNDGIPDPQDPDDDNDGTPDTDDPTPGGGGGTGSVCGNLLTDGSVTISEPAANSELRGSVTVTAQISGLQSVQYVEFYINNSRLSLDTSAPYQVALPSHFYNDGSYDLKAIAILSEGNCSSSEPISVTFANGNNGGNTPNPTPTGPLACQGAAEGVSVALQGVTSGQTLKGSVPVSAQITGSENIDQVAFFVSEEIFAQDYFAPYATVLYTTQYENKRYGLYAGVKLKDGKCAFSDVIFANIDNSDIYGCENYSLGVNVAWVKPQSNETISGVYPLEVTIDGDQANQVKEVVFGVLYQDNALGRVSDSPYVFNLDTSAYTTDSNKTLRAVAVSEDGSCAQADIFTTIVHPAKPVISNVSWQTTNTTINISWFTDKATNEAVGYYREGDSENQREIITTTSNTSHKTDITGLTANTTYFVTLGGEDSSGLKADPKTFKITTSAGGGGGGGEEPDPGAESDCSASGFQVFHVCYYNDMNFKEKVATDTTGVRPLNFQKFENESPYEGVDPKTYSIAWQGAFTLQAGIYEFELTTNDGGNLYLDGERIISDREIRSFESRKTAEAVINSTRPHTIKLDYFQNTGNATARLSWRLVRDFGNAPPGCTGYNDTQIVLAEPQNGATVRGQTTARIAEDADLEGPVSTVMFMLDNKILKDVNDRDMIMSYNGAAAGRLWDSRLHPNGSHIVKAVARMSDGTCTDWSDEGAHAARVLISNLQYTISELDVRPADIYITFKFKTTEAPRRSTICYGTSNDKLNNSIVGFYDAAENIVRATSTLIAGGAGAETVNDIGYIEPGKTYYYRILSESSLNDRDVKEASCVPDSDGNAGLRYATAGPSQTYTKSNYGATNLTASRVWSAPPCSAGLKFYYDRYPINNRNVSPYGGTLTVPYAEVTETQAEYTAIMTGLTGGVTYYYRYETNCSGTLSGQFTFNTPNSF